MMTMATNLNSTDETDKKVNALSEEMNTIKNMVGQVLNKLAEA